MLLRIPDEVFVWQSCQAVGKSYVVKPGCGLQGVKFVAITIKTEREDSGKV